MAEAMTRTAGAVLSLTVAATVGACSLTPADFPSPRAGVDVDYTVTIEFASALNLPVGADVMLNGLRVGEVQSLTDSGDSIDATVGLAHDVRVPGDTEAIIRQNTLLGDTYIALRPPIDGGSDATFMHDGDVLPQDRTVSPPQLEDTIAVLAYFVNGGSIQKVQDSMASLNGAMPPLDQVRSLAATVSVDLADLAAHTGEVDRTLNGLNDFARSFDDRAPELQAVFSPEGAHYWNRIASAVVGHISTLLPSLGSIFAGGQWLVPMLESLAGTAEAGRGTWDSAPVAATRLGEFLRTTLLPFVSDPSVNVTAVTASDGTQLVDDATDLLRMLGATR